MAEAPSSPVPKHPPAEPDIKSPAIEPLTRRRYKRLPATQRQIEAAAGLDARALIERARQRDKDAADYMSAEALVYFIRHSDGNDDKTTRDALFRELLERCIPFFRGKFRGFEKDVQEDLQGEVQRKLVEDLLAPGNTGDFMQVRFWKYLERKTIDACRTAFRHEDDLESLDTGYSGDGESEGLSKLETLADKGLTPEQLTELSQGLARLPVRLRHVFLLRHYVGMKIGADDPATDGEGEVTLARHFKCTGRTIHNRLKEANHLLASFREKEDDYA